MAFLDETGLAELWSLVKAEDAKGVKIAAGSYVGTGTYGSSNPNSLTFDFVPKIVMLFTDKTGRIQWNSGTNYLHAIISVDALTTTRDEWGTGWCYSTGVRTNFNSVASVASKVVAILSLTVSKKARCSTLYAIPCPTKDFKLSTTSACFTNGDIATFDPMSQLIFFQ